MAPLPTLVSRIVPTPTPAAPRTDAVITVHQTISSFAFLYEKVRTAVDDKDEIGIRRAAIVRILKRQFIYESDAKVVADHLVRELIAARYVPNGALPEIIIDDVAVVVQKLQSVLRARVGTPKHREWLHGVCAVEIERLLVNGERDNAAVHALFEKVAGRIELKGADLTERDLALQTMLACYRTVMKADGDTLSFVLMGEYLPEWMAPESWRERAEEMAERLVGIHERIAADLSHPLGPRVTRTVMPWAVSLNLLRDVLDERPELIADKELRVEKILPHIVRKAEERYAKARKKLRRGTARATLYLLVTKMVVALVLELPLEWYWFHQIDVMSLAINLSFPPVTMFLVGLLIRVPGADNTERLKTGVAHLVSVDPLPAREIRVPAAPRTLRRWLFRLLYLAAFIVTFGGVAAILRALDFTWVSAGIFVFFLCVVSFFAFRLRSAAREMVVVEKKQGLGVILVDFFSLPVLRAGQWLSRTVSRVNIFIFLFDFLIEAPFKLFLEVLEEWFAFLKEKKEELQ